MMLTPRTKELLDFITAYIRLHGLAPTYDEMKAGMGLASKGRINAMILQLEQRGHIRRMPKRARAIEVIRNADNRCPNCGQLVRHRSAA